MNVLMDSMVEVTVLLEHFVSGIVDSQLSSPCLVYPRLHMIVLLEYLEYRYMLYRSISVCVTGSAKTRHNRTFFKFLFVKHL